MERKVLLFGLLQSLSLFASADSDLNGTSMDNGIETDMASIEEYTRTLPMMESPAGNAALNSDQLPRNLLPFGALKTDWTRLHLLHDALPRDSVVKQKFEHLFRLLLVAYNQATRFSSSSESTKSQNTSENETSTSSVDLNEETPFTSTSISNPISPLSNYAEDHVDSDTMKDISQHSTDPDDEEKFTAPTNIPDTGSTEGGVETLTLFDINIGSSTETVLKETFDRPVTCKAFPETPSKTMTTTDGRSPSSTSSARGLERTQEEADRIFSHQSSTRTVPAEETTIVDENILAATVSNSVSSRSQPSYSSLSENLATSTKTENNVGSPEPVTTNPKERYSTYEDYSSATTILSYEPTEGRSLTSSRKEQFLLSTTEEKNKSLLSVTKSPSTVAEKEESLSTKTQSQSPLEVKLSTEGVSSSTEKLSTTMIVAEFHTEANVSLTKNSTESSSIDKEKKYEEIKSEKDTEFVASGKSTGDTQDIWGSTPRSTVASGSSTDSTNTGHHIHERSTTVAKASDLPRQGQHVNKNDTSKDELVTEENTVDEHVKADTGSITEESAGSRKATDKTNYIKNPLHAGSSRRNDIFRDIKHRTGNESGGNVESGNVWRPHLVRVPPVGNNIWRFDKAPENARTHGYRRLSPFAVTRANSGGEPPVSSDKGPFSSRTNLLMPRKRGSANADVEKLFRWFYTRGQIEPSNKSRSNENDNTKITIRCKKT